MVTVFFFVSWARYGSGTDKAQVAITVLGTVASMVAFVLQVLLVTRALKVGRTWSKNECPVHPGDSFFKAIALMT